MEDGPDVKTELEQINAELFDLRRILDDDSHPDIRKREQRCDELRKQKGLAALRLRIHHRLQKLEKQEQKHRDDVEETETQIKLWCDKRQELETSSNRLHKERADIEVEQRSLAQEVPLQPNEALQKVHQLLEVLALAAPAPQWQQVQQLVGMAVQNAAIPTPPALPPLQHLQRAAVSAYLAADTHTGRDPG
eukprot:2449244-Amphidinium_carterae.1